MPITLDGTLGANVTGNANVGGNVAVSRIVNGNSNITIAANGNVTISSAGTANVVTVANTGVTVAGNVNVGSGNNVLINNEKVITWVELTPGVTEVSFNGSVATSMTLNPATIPAAARYVLADVFITANISDHQNFVFGSATITSQKNWVDTRGTQPSTTFGNLSRQAITLTYHGEVDNFSPNYGIWFSSQVMPVTGRTVYYNNYGNSGSAGWIYILVKAYSL